MRRKRYKMLALSLVAAMAFGGIAPCEASAAKRIAPKLSSAKVSLKTGGTKTIKVINVKKAKVKKVKWSISKKAKKIISLQKKSKYSVKIKALKKGSATITAKIQTKKKTYTKKIKVTVKKKTTTMKKAPEVTKAPENTKEPVTQNNQEVKSTELIHYDMTCSADGQELLDRSGKGNNGWLVDVDSSLQENQSLLLQNGGYIQLPEDVFAGRDTMTISIWLKNYSGAVNTSAMFVGTKENFPVSYWLLNPSNLQGRMKSVMTNEVNATAPYNTEVGVGTTIASKGVDGPFTGTEWNHYVTVIKPDSITNYFNGKKVGTSSLSRKFSDYGNDLVAYIGKSSYPDATYTGFVREVQVFEDAKNDGEIQSLYEKTKGTAMEKKGTKSEIFIADRADPYITKGPDGYYYFTASYPMRGAADKEGSDRIILRRSETIEGLKTAEEKSVWDESESSISHRFIWAPELHYIGGKWYLYYAASGSANNRWDINCHVLMCAGDDPYNDDWVEKGKFQAASGDSISFTGFSLDMTYFECNGKSYVIWAQKVGNSNLYMAEVNPEEPWKTTTKAMLLTKPEYYWEKVSIPVNEGPSVLIHDGKVIVAYSASATGPEYCIGYLYADEKANLLDKKSWTKQKTPALTSEDLVDEYGPGHNSFTKDEEGNYIFVYHSRAKECYEGNCGYGTEDPLYDPCRSARIRKVQWDENGLPILNQ
ncbi:MAG: family 43 glycosylhydrolase [Eubacterium sp.]|nr:family 43 glycosylhydrolase [Eubacterium sp.]